MISVVIPAFNEEKTLAQTLQSLSNQTTKQKFEVILVDNNSTDKTVSVAKKFLKKLNLKIISQKIQGRGAARKKGFQTAKGEIIFSTDADAIVPPNWLIKHLKVLQNPQIIATTGYGFIQKGPIVYNYLFPVYVFLYKLFLGHYPLHGFNFAVRKSAYQKSGGFDEKLNNQEDVALGLRLSKTGRIAWVNEPSVIVSSRRFKKGLIPGLYKPFLNFVNYLLFKKVKATLKNFR